MNSNPNYNIYAFQIWIKPNQTKPFVYGITNYRKTGEKNYYWSLQFAVVKCFPFYCYVNQNQRYNQMK